MAVESQCLSFPSIYFRINERKIKTYSLHGVKFVIIRCTMDRGIPYGVNLFYLPKNQSQSKSLPGIDN